MHIGFILNLTEAVVPLYSLNLLEVIHIKRVQCSAQEPAHEEIFQVIFRDFGTKLEETKQRACFFLLCLGLFFSQSKMDRTFHFILVIPSQPLGAKTCH